MSKKGKIENLKPFKPGQSGNPKGRPPKLLSSIVEQYRREGYTGATAAQVVEAYEVLINLTEAKIKEIIADSDAPMLLRIVGKAMLGARGTEMVEKILERAYGKAKQQTDITTGGQPLKQVFKIGDNIIEF